MIYIVKCLFVGVYATSTVTTPYGNGWEINRSGPIPEGEPKYDCDQLGTLCSEKNCKIFAEYVKSLPTESIYDAKGQPKETLSAISYNNGEANLLCVNENFFHVKSDMTGLVKHKNSLDFVVKY